jgi:hypothetical protein
MSDKAFTKGLGVMESVIKDINPRVYGALPALAAEEEFKKISESGDLAKTQYFLKQQIPDYESIMKRHITKTVEEFKRVKAGLS